MFDVTIIGAGPAGISSALYAKRAGLKVLVLYYGESQLEKAHKIDNYYGFADGITGKDLYAAGISQARNLEIEVKEEEVVDIQPSTEKSFCITTSSAEYETTSIIIATGNKKLKPKINGLEEFESKGISYCAVCDGFFYRKKDVAVIGSKRYAFTEALHLAPIASSVTILTDGESADELEALKSESGALGEKITIDTRKIASITGAEKVEGVSFEQGDGIKANGIFIAVGEAGGADFARKLGLEMEKESIKTNEKMETNAKGIFAAGNVSGGLLQVCKAVYEGGVAGLSAVSYVRSVK
jgi:thioredoxin reductase (NADPH)